MTGHHDGGGLYGVKPVDPGILYHAPWLKGSVFISSYTKLFFYFSQPILIESYNVSNHIFGARNLSASRV